MMMYPEAPCGRHNRNIWWLDPYYGPSNPSIVEVCVWLALQALSETWTGHLYREEFFGDYPGWDPGENLGQNCEIISVIWKAKAFGFPWRTWWEWLSSGVSGPPCWGCNPLDLDKGVDFDLPSSWKTKKWTNRHHYLFDDLKSCRARNKGGNSVWVAYRPNYKTKKIIICSAMAQKQ